MLMRCRSHLSDSWPFEAAHESRLEDATTRTRLSALTPTTHKLSPSRDCLVQLEKRGNHKRIKGGQVLASLVGRATLTCRVKIWMHESRWGVIPSGHHHDSRVKRLPLILLTARPGCTRAKSGKEQSQTKQTGTSTVHSRLC